jgi:hypothetical protein
MGDAKRAVSSYSKVEGSISAFHLHRETTYFCSHYFKSEGLLSSNSLRNNPRITNEDDKDKLSMLNNARRPRLPCKEHWLSDAEWTSCHVHVLINCIEVKPYLE